ncbi:MAG: insulinase family protein [Paracoccaceae bacterium]|nr:insulinase family protein [Paracoccaceae bacterium]MDG1737636.1 insulinase family protein [Paracoccaceae bacterium]MDG2257685.1 insulinase family protein [Paracoccaceae bacterium]
MKFAYWLFTAFVGAATVGLTIFYFKGAPITQSPPPAVSKGIETIESDVFGQVYFIHDSDTGVVKTTLSFPSGEARNPYSEGMAHYVEHLAWASAFTEASGAKNHARHSNASTTEFSTNYWMKSSSRNLRSTVETLISVADPLTVSPQFAAEERDIILREYEFRQAEKPLLPIVFGMNSDLYSNGPLSRSVLGTPDKISKYWFANAKKLHQASHNLSEATLVIYGDVPKQRVKSLLASLDVPRISRTSVKRPDLIATDFKPFRNSVQMKRPGIVEDTYLYKSLAPLPDCGSVARCDLIIWLSYWILDSPMQGGVAGPLRFDDFITRSFWMDFNMVGTSHALLEFDAVPDRDANLNDIDRVFEKALRVAFEGGIPQQSFDRAKQQLTEYLGSFEYLEDYNAEQTALLLSRGAEVYSYDEEIQALKGIQLSDIQGFLAHFSNTSRTAVRKVYSE